MSEYVPRFDVWVTQRHMPMRVRGFCKMIGMDNCAIVNEDLSDEKKRETVEHEARHLQRGDLQSDEPASMLERE